ncbi:AraC family transcriptional regulator [Micromonospora sp. MS34]|uniref:AraC family transcriptional regulator n=1 Tax=Micromonospora sp. MS34 TaxID=3385971 RepID=UPI0039A12463
METLVHRAIAEIREHYDEPLSLDDLARTATMSKFHFLRTFREFTGVTPIRFLSAVRIDEAKRLLFATSLTVADISTHVGYLSLGTFTRRFTECVGLTPTAYRRLARGTATPVPEPQASPGPGTRQITGVGAGTLGGTVTASSDTSSPIFVGLFGSRIPQGRPVVSTALAGPGPWLLPEVPAGSWHLLVAATAAGCGDAATRRTLLVGTADEIRVRPGARICLDVTLRPLDWTRPPLMVALPGVEALRAAA